MLWTALISFSQKQKFYLNETSSLTKAYNELNVDISDGSNLRDKRTGRIIFSPDTTKTFYVNFFNDRFLVIKQVPKDSKYVSSASTIFVPIIDAVIVDLLDPRNVYYLPGNAKTNILEIISFKQSTKKIILFTKDRRLIFRKRNTDL